MKQPQALDNLSPSTATSVTARLFACTLLFGITVTSGWPLAFADQGVDIESPIEDNLARTRESTSVDLEWDDLEQRIDVGELDESRITLETRVRELQSFGDRYDGGLVKPLSLLGRIYHVQKDYPRAAETFALATQISRIANGLHSSDQLELVHLEIASLKAMGNVVEANKRHEYAFSIAARQYGRFAQQLIPELLKIATWYTSTGDVIGARGRFSDARMLLSADKESAQSDLMIIALRGLANSYRDERFPHFYEKTDRENEQLYGRNGLNDHQDPIGQMTDHRLTVNAMHKGTEALVDVLRIEGNRLLGEQEKYLRANPQETPTALDGEAEVDTEPRAVIVANSRRRRGQAVNLDAIESVVGAAEVDKTDFLAAMLQLADWYLLMEQDSRAFAWYQQAYTIAKADPNTDAVAMFNEPKLLYFPRPKDPKLPERLPTDALEKGHVALLYDIDHRGHTRRWETVESQPKGLMDFRVRSSVKVSRYRPRILDGLPQPTAAYNFKHSFNYFPRNSETPPPNVINSDDLANRSSSAPAAKPES